MAEAKKRVSVLAQRIAAGKADPISQEEREIAAGLLAFYEKKYGRRSTRSEQQVVRGRRYRAT